ncbi:hypothetical protein [Actinocorallia longicatena]|uniref:Uncharacterized protein n=1 Tax=Actinocorallia longicatena TaxID=111803 RepID=A0ABP6QH37_9ACTN
MPTDPLTAHAATLSADAAAVSGCARRLRALASAADAAFPAWFAEAVSAHLTACTIAAEDLSRAAEELAALEA